jgi:hypothetical protein
MNFRHFIDPVTGQYLVANDRGIWLVRPVCSCPLQLMAPNVAGPRCKDCKLSGLLPPSPSPRSKPRRRKDG